MPKEGTKLRFSLSGVVINFASFSLGRSFHLLDLAELGYNPLTYICGMQLSIARPYLPKMPLFTSDRFAVLPYFSSLFPTTAAVSNRALDGCHAQSRAWSDCTLCLRVVYQQQQQQQQPENLLQNLLDKSSELANRLNCIISFGLSFSFTASLYVLKQTFGS